MIPAPPHCPACGSDRSRKIGIRGTREHFGADPHAEPHIVCDVLRCASCDLIYADPLVLEMFERERRHYADPDRYRACESGGEAAMFTRRLELIEELGGSGSLLDIGAGKGEFVDVARGRGWRAEGIEPSAGLSAYAARQRGVSLHQGRLGEIAALNGVRFDVVTLNHVLEHVDQPRELLAAIKGHLKPAGLLFVEVPNCDATVLRLADLYFRLRGLRWSSRLSPFHPPFHRYGYTSTALGRLVRRAGYELVSVRTFSGRDRGYLPSSSRPSLLPRMRDLAGRVLDILGDRELLIVIARPT